MLRIPHQVWTNQVCLRSFKTLDFLLIDFSPLISPIMSLPQSERNWQFIDQQGMKSSRDFELNCGQNQLICYHNRRKSFYFSHWMVSRPQMGTYNNFPWCLGLSIVWTKLLVTSMKISQFDETLHQWENLIKSKR